MRVQFRGAGIRTVEVEVTEDEKLKREPSPPCICGHAKAQHFPKGACRVDECKCPLYGPVDPRQQTLPILAGG